MRYSVTDVLDWIEELKKRKIKEFQFKELPNELKILGIIRKAKVYGKVREKKRIKGIIIWTIE